MHSDQQDDEVTVPQVDGLGQVLSPLSPKIVEAEEQPSYNKMQDWKVILLTDCINFFYGKFWVFGAKFVLGNFIYSCDVSAWPCINYWYDVRPGSSVLLQILLSTWRQTLQLKGQQQSSKQLRK